MLSIGLMTGTSMDGIDAALMETDGEYQIKDLGSIYLPYNQEQKILFKAAEFAVRNAHGDMNKASQYFKEHYEQKLSEVVRLSTDLHISAVNKLLKETKYKTKNIDVIGYHGQCLFHQPNEKISVIIGDGQYLADQTGIKTVNDFRSNDIAHGGQGTPFAPLYHRALALRDNKIPLAVVNCGGISNITLITGLSDNEIIGFDTGPGNGLLDRLVKERTGNKESMDIDGKYGKNGRVHDDVLGALYAKSVTKQGSNFFDILPPKSLDIGDMKIIPEIDSLSLEDACATLAEFTASSIVKSLEFIKTKIPEYFILAGGGWNNPVIRQNLDRLLPNTKIMTADEFGWNSQAMEAQIFAYFAVRSLSGKVLSLPSTTGVSHPVTGGVCYRPKTIT